MKINKKSVNSWLRLKFREDNKENAADESEEEQNVPKISKGTKENIKITKTYRCKYCERKCKNKKELNRHLESTHKENLKKDFKFCCNVNKCVQLFNKEFNLKKHLKEKHNFNPPMHTPSCNCSPHTKGLKRSATMS